MALGKGSKRGKMWYLFFYILTSGGSVHGSPFTAKRNFCDKDIGTVSYGMLFIT